MTSVYTITALAKEFGLTTRAIRHYEDEGLLNPARDGHNRVFSHRDRVRLKLALRGKRLGFTLAEIRELFELYDKAGDERAQLEALLLKLARHRKQLEQRREDLDVMLHEIAFFEAQCHKQLGAKPAAAAGRTK